MKLAPLATPRRSTVANLEISPANGPAGISAELRDTPPRLTLHTLAAEVAELKSRLAVLERGAGPRDSADVALIRAIHDDIGVPFLASDALRFTLLERGARVRKALLDADIDNPHQLGKLLARCSKRHCDGLTVTRNKRRQWVVMSAMSNDTPSYP